SRDRLGHWTYFGVDSMRRATGVTNELGRFVLNNYCTCGVLDSTRDEAGNYTYFFRDNQGRATNVLFADNYSVTTHFNLLGQPTNVVDSAGGGVTNWFNNQGLPRAVSNAFGRVQTTIFDILDRATNFTGSDGVTVASSFDNAGRLLTRRYPDNGVESFGYTLNVAGPTSYTNQLGTNVVKYGYDPRGLKTNEIYPGISTNSFGYSPGGDLMRFTDGNQNTTRWAINDFGWLMGKTNAVNQEILRLERDANGNVTTRWTPQFGNTVYTLDVLDAVTNIFYVTNSVNIALARDAFERVTNAIDQTG